MSEVRVVMRSSAAAAARRSALEIVTGMVVLVVLIALVGLPQHAAAATTPTWMIDRGSLGVVENYLGNTTLATNAFDLSSTLEIGNPAKGWASQHVDNFTAYGPVTTAGSFLYALKDGSIPVGTTYVAYDNESWSLTPLAEQEDPGTYMKAFVSAAHEHGYKAILMPALDLTKAMPCEVSTEPNWENYLSACDVPGLVAASLPDVYEIQAQHLENDTSSSTNCGCYRWFVTRASAEAAAVAHIGEVLAGLSTNPEGATTSAQALATDTIATVGIVAGYWLNVPVRSATCPTCTITGDPGIAADLLWQLGDVGPGSQAISFPAPSGAVYGGTSTLSATGGNSGNGVVFSVDAKSAPGVCSLSGPGTATVTYTGAGTCVVDANQAGNADWLAAPEVTQTFSVAQAPQAIAFTSVPPSNATKGGIYAVSATGGASGSAVVFSSGTSSVCKVSGSTVSFVAAGTCTIDANQAGDADYLAAPTAAQSVKVAK